MTSLDNFILFDVAEAVIIDKKTGEKFLNRDLTTSGITQSSSETEIRGGRGSALLALIESEKSLEVSMANATVSKKWLEMQQGASFENKEVTMVVTEKVKVQSRVITPADPTDPDSKDEVQLYGVVTKTPAFENETVTYTNCEGDQDSQPIDINKEFIIADDFTTKEGDEITVAYKAKVEGEVLEIDAAVFPKGWELQLEVPAMDKCTQAITHKVVFIFDNVRPTSAFDMSFAMGEAIAPEMTVKIMKSCCSTGLGRMVIVPVTP